jgi:ASC-1-like (ASCH) protein
MLECLKRIWRGLVKAISFCHGLGRVKIFKTHMHHIAIMNKSWNLIPKIVSGQKTIESRWYQTRRAPWNAIREGDIIYFKNSGELVTARATVSKVLQFNLLNINHIKDIVKKYGKDICIVNPDPHTWGNTLPKYCILMHLKDAYYVDVPFRIDKTGFGAGAAWLCVEDVGAIRV